ncbi:lipase family protein [Amycolatopsis anabasis]|uniref:lipase family protein n=1 Tax=Amycolatopsis anabasis TaxID=1840409 RepID=UPI0015D2FB9C|nr:lipase family protein [Amycolatopsis anabasis]
MTASLVFDHHATRYSVELAHRMACASALAYKTPSEIENQAHDWGFDRVRHHHTTFRPPFPLEDTQAYTMASDHMVITAFRGTEPAQWRDWLSDVTTPPWPGPGGTGWVHYGFAEALNSVYPQVDTALTACRDHDQTVWFTGHSLGGGLAMLAAARWSLEQADARVDGVYTFGAPRTCDRLLATAYNQALTNRSFRFVNNNDIVPQLPPEPVFHHVNAARYIDSSGKIRDSLPSLPRLADHARGFTADLLAPASDTIRDHDMKKYLAALERNLTTH